MKKAYVVTWDNGEEYEDWYEEPLCVCLTKEAAESEVKRLAELVQEKAIRCELLESALRANKLKPEEKEEYHKLKDELFHANLGDDIHYGYGYGELDLIE